MAKKVPGWLRHATAVVVGVGAIHTMTLLAGEHGVGGLGAVGIVAAPFAFVVAAWTTRSTEGAGAVLMSALSMTIFGAWMYGETFRPNPTVPVETNCVLIPLLQLALAGGLIAVDVVIDACMGPSGELLE